MEVKFQIFRRFFGLSAAAGFIRFTEDHVDKIRLIFAAFIIQGNQLVLVFIHFIFKFNFLFEIKQIIIPFGTCGVIVRYFNRTFLYRILLIIQYNDIIIRGFDFEIVIFFGWFVFIGSQRIIYGRCNQLVFPLTGFVICKLIVQF